MIKNYYITILLFWATQLTYSQTIDKVIGQVQNEKKNQLSEQRSFCLKLKPINLSSQLLRMLMGSLSLRN